MPSLPSLPPATTRLAVCSNESTLQQAPAATRSVVGATRRNAPGKREEGARTRNVYKGWIDEFGKRIVVMESATANAPSTVPPSRLSHDAIVCAATQTFLRPDSQDRTFPRSPATTTKISCKCDLWSSVHLLQLAAQSFTSQSVEANRYSLQSRWSLGNLSFG